MLVAQSWHIIGRPPTTVCSSRRLNKLPEEKKAQRKSGGGSSRLLPIAPQQPGRVVLDGIAVGGPEAELGVEVPALPADAHHSQPHVQRLYACDWSQMPSTLRRAQALRPERVYPGHTLRPVPAATFQTVRAE